MCLGVLPSKASQATQFFCCQEKSWLCRRWKKTHQVSLNFFFKDISVFDIVFLLSLSLSKNYQDPLDESEWATLWPPCIVYLTLPQIEYSERVGKIVWRFVNVRLCWPYCFCCYFCRNCQFWNLNILYGATTGIFVKHSITNSPSYSYHLWLKESCISQQDHAKGVSQKET